MAYTDGYSIKGKFSSDTGVSGAKKKGNYKGLGYKGETKTSPTETKNYGMNTNVKVRADGTVKDDKPTVKDKAKSVSNITKVVEDAKKYEDATNQFDSNPLTEQKWNLNNAGSLDVAYSIAYETKGPGAGFYFKGSYYTAPPSEESYQQIKDNLISMQEQNESAQAKADSVYDLQKEVTDNQTYMESKGNQWKDVTYGDEFDTNISSTTPSVTTTTDSNIDAIYLNDTITTSGFGSSNDSSFTIDKTNPLSSGTIPPADLVTFNSMRTSYGQRIRRDQYILLGDVFNTVEFAPIFDGLKITGAKFNVNIPLFTNKKGTRFRVGG